MQITLKFARLKQVGGRSPSGRAALGELIADVSPCRREQPGSPRSASWPRPRGLRFLITGGVKFHCHLYVRQGWQLGWHRLRRAVRLRIDFAEEAFFGPVGCFAAANFLESWRVDHPFWGGGFPIVALKILPWMGMGFTAGPTGCGSS